MASVVYYAILRHLPRSTMPGGELWRMLRSAAARRMLASCGDSVNIEHGADFGTGRRVHLGNRSGIGIDARIHGPVEIGDNVMMGPEVIVIALSHKFADEHAPMIEQGFGAVSPVRIGHDVWIGTRAILLPGVQVGSGSIVGAGAVVTHDVKPRSIVAGNPARMIGARGEAEDAPTDC